MQAFQDKDRHLVVLKRGERLVASLTEYCQKQGLRGAQITGLGALMHAELGYYELPNKTYLKKTFTDDYELISLLGNVAIKDGQPFLHVHATLGDSEFRVFGGHLFEAEVAVVCEVSLMPYGFHPTRTFDECLGLAIIQSI